MTFFSTQDKAKISQALTRAEEKTSGEIIAVVTGQSDDYRFIALLWAALIALAIPMVLVFLPQLTSWSFRFQPQENIYLIQLVSFALLSAFFQWHPIRLITTPSFIKKKRAHRYAMEQFISQEMHHTSHRKGVLIFVSISEHYIEVIADQKVYQKVDKDVWKDVVSAMREKIQQNKPTQGFVNAIGICGTVLQQHFPPEENTKNELPNHLIEL